MKLAGSTLIYATAPLGVALRQLSALGFGFADLGLFDWAHLDPESAVGREGIVAEQIAEACHEATVTPIALNLGLHGTVLRQVRQLDACCQIAVDLDVKYVTIQAASNDSPLSQDLERAQTLHRTAQGYGLTLSVETHLFTLTEDPHVAVRYPEGVPGLGLTLDPSHYEAGPFRELGYDSLLPHVRFLHLRSAGRGGWNEVQIAAGTGGIDFPDLLHRLQSGGFSGDASVEYVEGLGAVIDAATEARRMREIVERIALASGVDLS